MIALKEKPEATKCSDHRTFKLMADMANVGARRLRRRMDRKIENVLGQDQFSFRRGKGACFIEWQKVFDCVKWVKLMQILVESGID